jgi:hypothetical protein
MSKTPEKSPPKFEDWWTPWLWTAEEKDEIVREVGRPNLLELEVCWRTWAAAEANPGSVRIIVTDKEGNKVIERPFRPRNVRVEAAADRTDFRRCMIRRAT